MATSAIAAATIKARNKVLRHFLSQNAVSPEQAIGFTADRRLQQRQFDRLKARGIIREASPGLFYIDIPAYQTWADATRRFRVVVILALLALFAAGFFFGRWIHG